MAERAKRRQAKPRRSDARPPLLRRVAAWLRRILWGGIVVMLAFALLAVLLYREVDPPTTHTIWSEARRLGAVERDWVPVEAIAPVMLRAAVAAEDADFCTHWGFDMDAIRAAMEDGAQRGGSTISQQVVKNVYLWQGRSWLRKLIEAGLTPMVEAAWPKRRILEVYLNVAEFDQGVFGVEAAARSYFGVAAADLTAAQAAHLAAVLPSPRTRDAARPSPFVARRAAAIADGAALIARDGRAACFEDPAR